MKLSGMSRLRNLESQVRDHIEREKFPAIDEMLEFVFEHYTTDQFDKISEVFHYDVWGGPKPSPENYELAASIWDILPGQIRIRLLDLDAGLKSFGTDAMFERLGAHKPVEGQGQSAPPSIG